MRLSPAAPDLRIRHVVKGRRHYFLLFNEGEQDIETALQIPLTSPRWLLDPYGESATPLTTGESLRLTKHAVCVLMVTGE